MKFIDYYKVLGVSETADTAEIKKAYRRLARKYHPDVSKEPDAEEKFKSINEANEVLKDKERRAEYDQLRKYGAVGGEEFRPPPGWHPHGGVHSSPRGGDFGGFSDFFESLFGGAAARGGFSFSGQGFEQPGFGGQDVSHQIEVTVEESFHGGHRRLSMQDPTGGVRSLDVRIPRGVADGQKIRLKGQGGRDPRGGATGDLFLEVKLLSHRLYKVEGRNVHLKLPITPWEAVLGAEVAVPTLGGPVTVKIPAGSKAGRKMRLKGKGMPGKTPGDQIVELQLAMPDKLSPEARALMEKIRDTVAFNPRAELGV